MNIDPNDPLHTKVDKIQKTLDEDLIPGLESLHMRADREIQDRHGIMMHIWTGITNLERKFSALFHRKGTKDE